tara:strand:+ start:99 stop:557 length:459 start_codon:yes stop_codon:yes gene_type:complete
MNNIVIETIKEVLDRMGVAYIDVVEGSLEDIDTIPLFLVVTDNPEELIGRDGDVFRALNYIVSHIVTEKDPDVERFQIDVDGYYKKQIESIKQKARFAAERARSFKSRIEMDPMNSFERMIVHSVFAESADIETHSEGDGKDRRIVLVYTGE